MEIWILASVERFYNKTKEVIGENNATFYLEFSNLETKQRELVEIGKNNQQNISDMVMNGLLDCSYRNFGIVLNDGIDLTKSIYSQPDIGPYIIDGRGGRENSEEIECIYLRVLEKESNKSTRLLYSKIVSKLKKDSDFKQGFNSKSLMAKKALYDIQIIDKIKKFNLNNPLSLVPL